jgi:hypothetical protein
MPWAAVTAGAAVAIAALAFMSDRWFRRRDTLSRLLERFEAAGFYVLIWRAELLTRGELWSLDRVAVGDLLAIDPKTADGRRIRQLLAEGDEDRASMHEIYFYALRVHAWLTGSLLFRGRMTRLLNDSFGYQLLATFLDHRMFACRLQDSGRTDSYYPVAYGCLDPAYMELVDRLAEDFLSARRQNPRDQFRLLEKWETTNARLDELLRQELDLSSV